jgi:molybdate transport system substrate-binding protein
MMRRGTASRSARVLSALVLLLSGAIVPAVAASPSPAALAPSSVCDSTAGIEGTPGVSADVESAPSLTVAAGSDLRYAMDDLVAAFEIANPGQSVEVTYGSSGNFFAQISQGAPFDVYFSADIEYPRALEEAGLAEPGSTRPYAEGRIVTWVREDSTVDAKSQGLASVLDPAVERVAIANPEHAPYGRAAQAAMEAADLWEAVQPRLVLGENISQAAQFVESGAADVGILALSLAIAPPLCHEGRYALVPADLHPPILQGALILADARHPDAAAAFLDFVLGPQGREVLDRYGFLLPES